MTREIRPKLLSEIQPLSAESAEHVRRSLAKIRGDTTVLSGTFYDILFRRAPATRALFPADMTLQNERLAKALIATVRAAANGNHQAVVPALRHWGVRHRLKYGVSDDLYVHVCHALVQAVMTLTDPTDTYAASAWTEVYEWLVSVMIDGADEADTAHLLVDLEPDLRSGQDPIEEAAPTEEGPQVEESGHRRHRSEAGWFSRLSPFRDSGAHR